VIVFGKIKLHSSAA